MKKFFATAAAASLMALSAPVMAAVSIDADSLESTTGPTVDGNTTTIGYSDSKLEEPTFYEWLTCTNTVDGLYSFTLTTSSANIDFTSAFISNAGGTVGSFAEVFDNGTVELWELSNLLLASGQYTVNIYGDNEDAGALSGNITITPAVPEPTTWMMLILGLFGIGHFMRRKTTRQGALLPA